MTEWISAMTRNPFSRILSPRIFWQSWLHCWYGDIVLGKTLLLNLYFKKTCWNRIWSIIGSKFWNWVHIIQFCVGENGAQAPFFQLKIPTWSCSCSSYFVNWYAIVCEDVVSFFLFIQQILIKGLGGGGTHGLDSHLRIRIPLKHVLSQQIPAKDGERENPYKPFWAY